MAGTIQVLRPNQEGLDNAGGYAATGGAGSLAAVTSDNSDATFMVGIHTGTVTLGYTSYTLAANERALRARVRFRAIGPSLGTQTVGVTWNFGNFTDGDWTPDEAAFVGAGPANFTGAWHTAWPTGAELTQSLIDKIQARLRSTLFGGGTAVIFEEYIDLEVVKQPTVVLNAPTGTNPGATHRPTVSWTPTIGDGYAQKGYQFKVFNKALNPSPVFGNTLGLVYDSTVAGGTATSKVIPVTLGNGDYRVLLAVIKDFNGQNWFSPVAQIDFTMADNPPVPTAIGPTGTIASGFPNLQAKAAKSGVAFASNVYVEWQVAQDAAFTTAASSFIEPTSKANTGGVHFLQTTGTPFAQTTWFVRARTHDLTGGLSAYSAAVSFAVAHVPTALPTGPLEGQYRPTGVQNFAWEFVAWSPTETQTAFQVQVMDPAGVVFYDSGKVLSTNQFATTPITVEQTAQWRVRVWDDSNVPSVYSDPITFQIAALPVVTFTNPTSSPLTDPAPVVSWAVTSPVGRLQAGWRLVITNDDDAGATVFDSGGAFGGDTSVPIPAGTLTNATHYTFLLTIIDSSGVPGTATIFGELTQFPPPSAPTGPVSGLFTIPNQPALTGPLAIGTISGAALAWDGTALGTTFVEYEVARQDHNADGTDSLNVIARIVDEAQSVYNDQECARAAGGLVNSYKVRVVDQIGGPSDWLDLPDVVVPADDACALVLCSNWSPTLTVAYADRPGYSFATDDAAGVKTARIYGAPMPVGFRAPGRIGDIFSRTLIVAAHDPSALGVNSGRVLYDALLARVRDTTSPYVCVTDGMGRRWFVLVSFGSGDYTKVTEGYAATVTFTEVSVLPVPVVTDLPWIP